MKKPGLRQVATVLLFSFTLTTLVIQSSGVLAQEKKEEEPPEVPEDRWKARAGGQIRLRGDFARNQNLTDFTFTPGGKEAQILNRTRLHGFIENPALSLKGFAEIQQYGRWGGVDRRSDIHLYQGYIEWEGILGSPISLKAGRQEFSYGSTFFLGPNDFYNGLSWDSLKVSLNASEDLVADLIGGKMAKLNPGDANIYLMGLYTTYKLYKEGSVEGYLFYNRGGFPFLHREFEVKAGQKWLTLGARFAGKVDRFDFELEPQFQWGKVREAIRDGKEKVRAYGGHVDLGYTLKLPWEPRVFAAYAFGSGDDDPLDGKFTQFHGNIFNDNYLVGDTSVITDLSGVTVNDIHSSGMHVFVAGISVNPLSDLNLNVDIHRFIASKGISGFSKDLGVELNLVASYKLRKHLSFLIGLNGFFTGRFFEQASGSRKDVNYAYIQAQLEF